MKQLRNFGMIMFGIVLLLTVTVKVYAADEDKSIPGKVYEFGEKDDYEFSSASEYQSSDETDTFGKLSISGDIIKATTNNGIPSYTCGDGSLYISYTYNNPLLTANDDTWHVVSDNGKKLNGIKLDDKIMKGVLILQTSRDGINWIDDYCETDVFTATPVQTESFYETKEIQMINGCYYRVIVAYKTAMRTSIRKIISDTYDYKKYTEVYEFYVQTQDAEEEVSRENSLNIGEVARTDKGYATTENIVKKDPHYGWKLGNFFVVGFTENTTDLMGKDVFLKNIGDKVTLCFELNQDIDALNDNSKLSICSNSEGYDEKFQINKMDFGRGTLIIEYTDYENVTHDPLIYTNFLEANTALDADTKVQLFEEGDYKVSLDYEILKDGLGPADKYTHYCISFEFSVRNANCMVYPFDVVTGEELTNTAVTPNGFYLDLAKSRYLKMNITKEVLKDGANGLTEDTRFNTASKDGDTYTDEGIYTITVKNEYTGKETTKKIYVGDNAVLTAYMVTGMSISQINELMAQGAVINEDGTITIPEATDKVEEVEMESDIENDFVEESIEEVYETSETENETVISDSAKNNNTALIIIICLVLCVVIVILIFKSRKHSVSKDTSREGEQ